MNNLSSFPAMYSFFGENVEPLQTTDHLQFYSTLLYFIYDVSYYKRNQNLVEYTYLICLPYGSKKMVVTHTL